VDNIVRLRNTGEAIFKDQYGGVPYVCPAGDTIVVPFEAVCLWLGDPRVVDRPTLAQYDRRGEVDRVKTRIGATIAEAMSLPWSPPALTIETLEGKEIVMCIQDPEGNGGGDLFGSIKTGLDDTESVAQELEILKRQQGQLLQRLEDLQAGQQKNLDDIPDDIPTKIPVDRG
jgi:hypothetical protein